MSACVQTYPNTKVFVSDEGSDDDSWEKMLSIDDEAELIDEDSEGRIVMQGSYNDTDIYFVKQPKGDGPSAARNRLIKMAWETTDFFSVLDADDTYMPTKVELTMDAMMEDPNMIGMVYNDAIIQNKAKGTKVYEYREAYSRVRIELECITSNTPLLNKIALQRVGLYDEEMRTAEDWDLALRITEKFVAIHVPEALHIYNVTGRNTNDTVSKEVWMKNWQRIHQKVQQRRNAASSL